MFAVFAWDLIYQMILLLRMCTVLHFYKRLAPYVGRLGSSANFQGVTDLLCPHTEVTYIEDVEHLLSVIFSYCLVCVMSFLMQGLHHCGACEATGVQRLLQVFQLLLLPAVMTDSVCPVPRTLDYSSQDLWMVVEVEVDIAVGVNFLSKH